MVNKNFVYFTLDIEANFILNCISCIRTASELSSDCFIWFKAGSRKITKLIPRTPLLRRRISRNDKSEPIVSSTPKFHANIINYHLNEFTVRFYLFPRRYPLRGQIRRLVLVPRSGGGGSLYVRWRD